MIKKKVLTTVSRPETYVATNAISSLVADPLQFGSQKIKTYLAFNNCEDGITRLIKSSIMCGLKYFPPSSTIAPIFEVQYIKKVQR